MTFWFLLILGSPVFALEIMSLNGSRCRALGEKKSLLEIEGVSQFLIRYDLSTLVTHDITAAYSKTGDDRGLSCVSNMTALVNLSLLRFKKRLIDFQRERMETQFYLKSEYPVGRSKRMGASSIAILMSVFGFALSATGLAVTEAQIQDINSRLSAMSRQIDHVRKTQRDLSANIEYLKEESEFLGFETNLLADYINQLKEIYSCDMVTGFFEVYLSAFDRRLDGVFRDMLS